MLSKLLFVTLFLGVSCACAQQTAQTAHSAAPARAPASTLPRTSTELSSVIDASYYHPDNLTLMDCDVSVDWDAFYRAVKLTVPEDRLRILKGAKIHSRAVRGMPVELRFDWAGETMPGQEQIESGMKQMVGGFYQMYWPMIAAPIIGPSDKLEGIESLPSGGVKASVISASMRIALATDRDGAPTHYDFDHGPMGGAVDIAYLSSPKQVAGDLRRVASMKIVEHMGASSFDVDMKLDYQDVDGFSIPRDVSFGLVGAYAIDLQFSGCTASTFAVSQ